MTPQEAWSAEKPNVKHFHVFGCITYAQILEAKRKRLDDYGEKCIFIGYIFRSKAYMLYNLISTKLIESRDVIFSEDESRKWDDQEKGKGNEELVSEEYNDTAITSFEKTPPMTLRNNGDSPSSSPSLIKRSSSSKTPIRKRDLRDIYDKTTEVEELIYFVYIQIMNPYILKKLLKKKNGNLQ